jgi:hypothetical protein
MDTPLHRHLDGFLWLRWANFAVGLYAAEDKNWKQDTIKFFRVNPVEMIERKGKTTAGLAYMDINYKKTKKTN